MKITLATKITIARIVLIVPTIVLYIVGALQIDKNVDAFIWIMVATAILFALVCATDFIDGYIARKTHTVSDLGKFLDPVADKVIIVVMLFLLVYFQFGFSQAYAQNGLVIAILSAIILSRELLIGVFRSIAASKNLVLAADIFGKIKTIFLDVSVTALILAFFNPIICWISSVLFYIGAFFAVYSGANYIFKNRHVLKNKEEAKEEKAEA